MGRNTLRDALMSVPKGAGMIINKGLTVVADILTGGGAIDDTQSEQQKIAEEDKDFRQKASMQAAEEEYRRHLAAYEQNLRGTRIRDQQTWNSLNSEQIVKSISVTIKEQMLTSKVENNQEMMTK